MANTQKLDIHHKALALNLDPSIFGSFAEIGAGQEVARWFLLIGGASGTVAKAISAYDKEVSEDLYGPGSRHVSKQRLEAMLDNEWADLQTQLGETRGPQTRFFSFADTDFLVPIENSGESSEKAMLAASAIGERSK